jgi:flagellin
MLSIQSNIASLVAQQNLNGASDSLNTSLQRLSSGLKINTGADGPAALVISNEQGAQIAGLQSAIDNTNQAVSMVQTAEGALSEVNNLLVQIRGLALSAANSAVNDPTALAADQAQIQNALQTIDNIASNTQFGTKKLLDGSSGVSTTLLAPPGASSALFSVAGDTGVASGTYNVNITAAAQKARVNGSSGTTGATLAADDVLTLNGTTINLSKGATQQQIASAINQVSSETNVSASVVATEAQTAGFTTTVGTAAPTTTATADDLATVNQFHGTGLGGVLNTNDTIKYSGVDAFGRSYSGTFIYGATGGGGNGTQVNDLLNAIQTTIDHGSATTGVNGDVGLSASGDIFIESDGALTAHSVIGASAANVHADTSVSLSFSNGTGGSIDQANNSAGNVLSQHVSLLSADYGSSATITVKDQNGDTGLSAANVTATVTGQNVAGTINGQAGTGSGNVLTGPAGTNLAGLSLTINALNGDDPYQTVGTAAGTNAGSLVLTNNTLTFQIGANAGQTAMLAINNVHTDQLATGISNTSGFQNLGQINVTTAQGAQDSLALVDAAINQISTVSGNLGSFQTNTLQATATNLQTALTNTTSAQSVIRDTDFAAETAKFTQAQVLVQAGTTVLTNANATAQLILNLLK